MTTIKNLNSQYVEAKKLLDTLNFYNKKILQEQNYKEATPVEKSEQSIKLLLDLSKDINCNEFALLADTIDICRQYLVCRNTIIDYKNELLKVGNASQESIDSATNEVKAAQNRLDELNRLFEQKHTSKIDSTEALNNIISKSIADTISDVTKTTEQLKNEARTLLGKENNVELSIDDPITIQYTLPSTLLVARYPLKKISLEIVRDIGITNTYHNIDADLRNQGNIILSSDFKHIADENIDNFIISYVLRFIEEFPLGSVNVHIFDKNANYLYKRLLSCFQTGSAGEIAKNTIQIHNTMDDLSFFKNVFCDDVFKKISIEKPDLFSIYEDDQSDVFNLIILRDGLVDGSGYASSESLDMINSLTKPGNTGHKCGLRFLIIDHSESFEKSVQENSKHILNTIQQNCELKISYIDEKFFLDDKEVETLHISDNIEMFIHTRASAIADAINSKEKNYISLDDISSGDISEAGNIMYIPVGKSGGSVVELPFSCKDEAGTTEGQCIGYMAIGQSGSGKSSFFHSLVLNGCMKYRPDDLQFWLLDFKNGGASSKYSKSGIPHIRIIAENNKIDDALCLFQMIEEEMVRRSTTFNDHFTDNIIDYNKKAVAENLKYFPRIIIAIDEVQEIFREDNASVIQTLISKISTRMRSAGMHFVMVAQNLQDGKSYMLRDAFLPSATGRICFRVAQDIPRESGFEDEFVQRKQEISELKTGEAYVSYGKGTIKKTKMAYISPQDMSERYFAEICQRYSSHSEKPLVIGSKKRLTVTALQQGKNDNYYDAIRNLESINGTYTAVIGEDAYRMSPLHIQFSQHENSSLLCFGSDKQIASSLCASIALSLSRQNVRVHLFNGDRTKIQDGNETIPHSFMYVCQNISENNNLVERHSLDQLNEVLKDIYSEYLKRQALAQKADDEEPTFSAVFLLINDLTAIKSYNDNKEIESDTADVSEKDEADTDPYDFSFMGSNDSASDTDDGSFREYTQTIISNLVNDGYRYNIHTVLAIKGDLSQRSFRITSGTNRMIFFNNTEYVNQVENSYYLKEMMRNISNDGEPETMAVWAKPNLKSFSKIRPIIYNMSDPEETAVLESLISGGQK